VAPQSGAREGCGARKAVRAVRWGAIVLIGWAALVATMLALERRFIFYPLREHLARPADFGLAAEERWLTAADGVRLHGWWLRGRGRRALVWYHGNAGNISHRLDNARRLIDRFGLDILLVDYRGYGLSEGQPEEAGLYRDGWAMYREAVSRFAPEQVVLFGRSLGAAVAIEVALEAPCGGVILETPFLSVPALARAVWPLVPTGLVRTRFDNEAKIAGLVAPKLFLHGDRDEIVPLAHAERLYALARPPKRFFLIPGASHNDTYLVGGDPYFEAWRQFLDETDPARRTGAPIR
jgi:fermentation-respiration switch protein FrsA (DUF1100 family)